MKKNNMNLIVNIDNINNNEIRVKKKDDEIKSIKIQPLDCEKESHFDFDDCYIDIFKNIEKIQINDSKISFQEKYFQFETLKYLYIKNCFLNEIPIKYIEHIKIKGDIKNIENNLIILEKLIDESKIEKLNEISLSFILNNHKNFDIFSYFKLYPKCFEKVSTINLKIKGNYTIKELEEKIDEVTQLKIKSLILKCYSELQFSPSFISFVEGLSKLENLYLNSNNVNINLLKLTPYLENNEDIIINFENFTLNKLKKIDIPLFQFNVNKNEIILYGEANIEFYNENNFNFISQIIILNNGEFNSVSFSNFDIENISYLSKLIVNFTNVKKVYLNNLNINENFVKVLKNKKLLNCTELEINNLIYLSNKAKSDFQFYVNKYKNTEKVAIKSMENISDFKFLLQNSKDICLEEIYEMNYFDLKRITDRCEYLTGLNLSKLDINDNSLCEKIKNILYKNRKSIKKIKITSDDTFLFIYQYLNSLSENDVFHCLEVLELNFDSDEFNEETKSRFLKEKYYLFPNITKFNLRIYGLNTNDKKEIYLKYPKLISLN